MSTVRKTITVTEQQRGGDFAAQKPAAGHDRWFRAQVQTALDKAGSPKARFHALDYAAAHLRKRAQRLAKTG
jgi:hypothetical protein